MMKSQDTTFSKAHLKDCISESSDASETCALALKKIRALEKKIERISTHQRS
jgi:hypothetical protein